MTSGALKTNNVSVRAASWIVVGAALLTLVLYLIPFLRPLSYPFLLLSTLVHEVSHGLFAVIIGGDFVSFKIWPDGSGVANISGNFGRFSTAFVAAGGLLGPPIFASLFFSFVNSKKRSQITLAIFGILLSLLILLVVRNVFGIFFVAFIVAICFYFSFGKGKRYAQGMLAFFAVQLALSVFSRGDYLFTKYAQTNNGPMPSDVMQISQALFLPYWFFGALIALFSLAVLLFGIKRVFK